jgi:hypothetical protein
MTLLRALGCFLFIQTPPPLFLLMSAAGPHVRSFREDEVDAIDSPSCAAEDTLTHVEPSPTPLPPPSISSTPTVRLARAEILSAAVALTNDAVVRRSARSTLGEFSKSLYDIVDRNVAAFAQKVASAAAEELVKARPQLVVGEGEAGEGGSAATSTGGEEVESRMDAVGTAGGGGGVRTWDEVDEGEDVRLDVIADENEGMRADEGGVLLGGGAMGAMIDGGGGGVGRNGDGEGGKGLGRRLHPRRRRNGAGGVKGGGVQGCPEQKEYICFLLSSRS